ncbi:hypothetical protein [Prochlorococcus marinus]|nr:hypothetical protein [Prochlorococcus marinus]
MQQEPPQYEQTIVPDDAERSMEISLNSDTEKWIVIEQGSYLQPYSTLFTGVQHLNNQLSLPFLTKARKIMIISHGNFVQKKENLSNVLCKIITECANGYLLIT